MQNKLFYLNLFLLFLILSCSDNTLPPHIITGEVTNINDNGALFHAKITSLGKFPIEEFGFVWDTIPDLDINYSEKYLSQKKVTLGNFEEKISVGLIKDKKYYVRAFIRSNNELSYGDEMSFTAIGGKLPEITSFSPTTGNLNTVLIITGRNLSPRSTIVKINQLQASIIRSTQDSIFVSLPQGLNKKTSAVTVHNLNMNLTAKDSFNLIAPEISSLENKQLTYGDEITIKGNNFSAFPSSIKVFFDAIQTTFTLIDKQTIKAIAPNTLEKPGSIKVVMNNIEAISADQYSLKPVEITDFNPKIALTGATITISGKNFSPILKNNTVYIGETKAKILSVTQNTIQVKLPLQDSVIYTSRNVSVGVTAGDAISTHSKTLLINDKCFRRANAPIQLRHMTGLDWRGNEIYEYYYAKCFVVGKLAYIGLNDNKEFWSYNSENNTWKKLSDFPGKPRIHGTGFVYNDKIYFGTGLSGNYSTTGTTSLDDWWEYDTTNDRWTQKATFIGGVTQSLAGYTTSTGCYVSSGFTEVNRVKAVNIWKYNPISVLWNKEIVDMKVLSNYKSTWNVCKVINDEVYISLLYDYDYYNYKTYPGSFIFNTKTNTFTPIRTFPDGYSSINYAVSMVLNNMLYVQNIGNRIHSYNKSTNTWSLINVSFYSELNYGIGFEIENLGYVGLGQKNHLYEFDPNR